LTLFDEDNSFGAACVPPASVPATLTAGPISLAVTLCPAPSAKASAYLATLTGDPNNCGSCGNVCSLGDSCVDGVCAAPCGPPAPCAVGTLLQDGGTACPAGTVICPSGACLCTTTATDPNNCGACGVVCDTGACQNGQCVPGCPAGQLCAVGAGNSSNAIGSCVSACSSYYGVPMTACGTGANAFCAFTIFDPKNCGSCGNACPAGQACNNGTCAPSCDFFGPCGSESFGDAGSFPTFCSAGQTCVDGGCVDACAAGQVCNTFFEACASSCG
jgi:hypothetical protein